MSTQIYILVKILEVELDEIVGIHLKARKDYFLQPVNHAWPRWSDRRNFQAQHSAAQGQVPHQIVSSTVRVSA